jgi:hypothetical protein
VATIDDEMTVKDEKAFVAEIAMSWKIRRFLLFAPWQNSWLVEVVPLPIKRNTYDLWYSLGSKKMNNFYSTVKGIYHMRVKGGEETIKHMK